jgi:hypothetical protein
MPEKTIIDASVPNAGRIYDYLLGGHHNFEVDRQAGDRIKAIVPFLPKAMRSFRWALQEMGPVLTEERGFDTILDFASGLPTMDHLHTTVPPGTTIIYSDIDPVTVEYGREILGDTPNTYFFQADARRPEELLNRPEVDEILGDKRHVAFVYWGISMYLTDDDIRHAARVLYDWSDETSLLAFYIATGSADDPATANLMEVYSRMGEALSLRQVENFPPLVKPWRADPLGYRTMEEWIGHDITVATSEAEDEVTRAGGGGTGVYLIK